MIFVGLKYCNIKIKKIHVLLLHIKKNVLYLYHNMMKGRGPTPTAKHNLRKNTSLLIILKCIMQFGSMTKREIQAKTGLSWGAVSNITTDLLSKKVIIEFKSTESLIGRKPSKFDITDDDYLIIGVDINIEGLTSVIIDLKCRVLKTAKINILKNSRNEILEQTKQAIHCMINDSNINKQKFMGIGIAIQGTVDVERGISVFSPNFSNWKDVPLVEILENEFGMPVFIEHDPNCMALTEEWLDNTGDIKNMLFIRLSMGIGMSIVINGEIYRGADGSAGEFGHLTMNPDGPRCTCGNYGCLEVYASGRSLLQQAREGIKLGRAVVASKLYQQSGELDLGLVVTAARQGDNYIRGLFENAGVYLGIGISNLIDVFNPDLIIIGGELAKCSDLFLDKVKEIARQKVWRKSRVNIVVSRHGSDSAAIGAAAGFIQKIFTGELRHMVE